MRIDVLTKPVFEKYLFPAGFLILNFVVKIIFLDRASIANDEPFSIYIAQMDIPAIVSHLSQGNNPPLFEIILHFWIKIFGISAFSTRFLPFLFSVTTVFFIYKLGVDFFSTRVALLSGLIFTFSNYHIYFAHETRVYSLFALLTTVSMYAYLHLISGRNSKSYLFILILTNILLIYAHFFGLLVPVIQTLCFIIFREIRKGITWRYLFALAVLVLSYIPYLAVLITRFVDSASNGTWISPSSFEDLYTMLWRFSNAPLTTVVFLILLLSALIKLIINKFSGITLNTKIILVWFLFPYLFMFGVSMKYLPFNIPVFFDRYVIFISVGFYLLMAVSINYVFAGIKYKNFLILLPVLFMIFTCRYNAGIQRNTAEFVGKVRALKTAETLVYICPDFFDLNFVYYYNTGYFREFDNKSIKTLMHSRLAQEGIFPVYNYTQIDTNLLKKAKDVIFVDAAAGFSSPDNNISGFLSKFYRIRETYTYSEIYNIYVFEKAQTGILQK
ncbi:MAG: glycosyltransferase family 39 protein [Bacteroidota bacterium]